MQAPVILLLTHDPELEDSVAEVLLQNGGHSHLEHCADDALQIVSSLGRDLDLAVIDFESGPNGLTLLSAIRSCRQDLPVIVVTHDNEKQVEALALAIGAKACLPKSVATARVAEFMNKYCQLRYQVALVACTNEK